MSTVDDRAEQIYSYLAMRQGQRFTLSQLCQRLAIQPGSKTTLAIRRARDLAAADGLHFPPAVPQNQFTYTVTSEAIDALYPAVQMGKIAAGVQRRAEVGYNFAEEGAESLPERLRLALYARQEMARLTAQYRVAIEQLVSDLVGELQQARRD